MYVIRRDVLERFFPQWDSNPLAQPIEIAVLGALILASRRSSSGWPGRPARCPPGPFRRRLERIADRLGFRFTDILVWDTGHLMVNACVTGILPGFRYVLLTDALIESLTPLEVAAVFGHEIGHIAHRHLLYFAFFFLGSLGCSRSWPERSSSSGAFLRDGWPRLLPDKAAIISEVARRHLPWWRPLACTSGWSSGSFRGGSSGRPMSSAARSFRATTLDCPPHCDLDHDLSPESARPGEATLCPVGIRIFAEALATVARVNGLDPNGRSWRHGSIASRIAFLEGLERHPERERSFQRGVGRLRLVLAAVLLSAVIAAVATQSWELLR